MRLGGVAPSAHRERLEPPHPEKRQPILFERLVPRKRLVGLDLRDFVGMLDQPAIFPVMHHA